MEFVGNNGSIVHRQTWYAGLEVLKETCQLSVLRLGVKIEIGFKIPHQAVTLCLYSLIRFVYRKIELCYKRPVHPWLANIIAELRSAVPRNKPHYNGHGDDNKQHTAHYFSPLMLL